VSPQAIRYPTDLNLLNEAREFSEQLIDILYSKLGWKKKPFEVCGVRRPVQESGFDNLQGEVFCNGCKVLVIVQQLSMMFECRSSNNAVVGLADGNTRLA
jgi:hypothetical protein